jgi:hypothetical protein
MAEKLRREENKDLKDSGTRGPYPFHAEPTQNIAQDR